jgi:hypothetical protein
MDMHAQTLAKPSLKSLTGCLILGLLIKIALSTALLAPSGWLKWAGPRASEAATSSVAPDSTPSQRLPHLLALVEKERKALLAREAAAAAKEEQLSRIKQEVERRLKELQALQGQLMENLEEEKRIKGSTTGIWWPPYRPCLRTGLENFWNRWMKRRRYGC